MNAKQEIIDHIGSREVVYVRVKYQATYEKSAIVEGTLSEVLPGLDFEYDEGYGSQYIDEGTIWYADGTWSAREEYDGSEWWAHRERPPLPVAKPVADDEVASLRAQVTALENEITGLADQLYQANNGGYE
jgi:hypothetical protein